MARIIGLLVALGIGVWFIFQVIDAPAEESSGPGPAPDSSAGEAQEPDPEPLPADPVAPDPVADEGPSEPEPETVEPEVGTPLRPPVLPAKVEKPMGDEKGRIRVREGTRERVLYRGPRHVAEFDAAGEAKPPVVGARLHREHDKIRIWELPESVPVQEVLDDRAVAEPTRRLSPLYFSNPSHQGTPLLSPGGITVQFKTGFTRKQVDTFAKAQELTGTKPLPIGATWYSFSSAPGDAALRLAERLHELEEVVLAKPDWFKERKSK